MDYIKKILLAKFNLAIISRYKLELMGIGVFMIIICHAYANGVQMSAPIKSLCAYCAIGVDIFFLLSGIGMYYSLSKQSNYSNSKYKTLKWYLHRYKRILLPYLCISIPWFIYVSVDIQDFFLNLSTISFYINGKGAWFVSILFILFIVTPITQRLLSSKNGLLILIFILIITTLFGFLKNESVKYHNLLYALNKTPCYFIGIYLGKKIKSRRKINYWIPFILSLNLSILLKIYTPGYYIWPLTLSVVELICLVLNLFRQHKFLIILGSISLESYLFNIALGNTVPHNILHINDNFRYVLIVVIGLLLSLAVNRLIKMLPLLISKIRCRIKY